jgi:acetyl/propionyl-CoA carboxylase alpha subunit
VTGLDLVALQIRIAAGEEIPLEQKDVKLVGHAIEARIYAEDPDAGFVPSPGTILAWRVPEGPGIRLDSGFETGETVTPHYDAMLAKLIATGRDRSEALARLSDALEEFWIAGIKTGLPFLRRLTANPGFAAGAYDTGFLEAEMASAGSTLAAPRALDDELVRVVAGAVAWRRASEGAGDAGAAGIPSGSRFRVTLPRQSPVEVELGEVRRGDPSRDAGSGNGRDARIELSLRIADREHTLELAPVDAAPGRSLSDAMLFDVAAADRRVRMSLVRKKSGELEVGLRDRVLRVKIEPV